MFNFICGEVMSVDDETVVVKSGNIGFELFVSGYTAAQCAVGGEVCLYTYLQVREDGLSLFGFYTKREKQLFSQLITVSGIGCKTAMSVLSYCGADDLAAAIITGDTKRLAGVKGIGKKSAERIVLELREKITPPENIPTAAHAEIGLSGEQVDAVAALVMLGLPQNVAESKVKQGAENGAGTVEELIKFALKK